MDAAKRREHINRSDYGKDPVSKLGMIEEVVFGTRRGGKGVLFVVFGDEVEDYGVGFPENHVSVEIFDCLRF